MSFLKRLTDQKRDTLCDKYIKFSEFSYPEIHKSQLTFNLKALYSEALKSNTLTLENRSFALSNRTHTCRNTEMYYTYILVQVSKKLKKKKWAELGKSVATFFDSQVSSQFMEFVNPLSDIVPILC